MNEQIARAALFSAIEGGHTFWSREIYSNSAIYVYEKLLNSGYDSIKYEKLITELKLHSGGTSFRKNCSAPGSIDFTV